MALGEEGMQMVVESKNDNESDYESVDEMLLVIMDRDVSLKGSKIIA